MDSEIKITRLSYKRIQMDYNVPVYMVNYKGDRMKGDVIKISIRYEKVKGEDIYCVISKSVYLPIEKLHFRYKVGKHTHNYSGSSYGVNGIDSEYDSNLKIDFEDKKITLNKFIKSYVVSDPNYINIVRDKKLEDIFS